MENETESVEVTVLMSVYKEKKELLKASIESILSQTYHDFEFIIINDGNNEELVSLVESYHDARIHLINNEVNLGLEHCLNKGIHVARGKYIVRMDADDISYPNRIEKQLAFMQEHEEYTIVSGNAEIFDDTGVYAKTASFGEKTKDDLVKETPFIHPTMMIRKKDLIAIGGYPLYRRTEDYAMAMNLYAHGYKGYVMKDVVLKYRMDAEGYQKKKYRQRITEAKVRWIFYHKMHVKWFQYIYVLKPLIAGLIPKKMMKKIHERRFKIK